MDYKVLERRDGPDIGYWVEGEGPPLLLVHGITSTHETFDELVPHLSKHWTVYTYDRRGRGASGDSPDHEYSIGAEYGDLADLIREVSDAGDVDLFGHSFGAYIALGGAAIVPRSVRRIVLYSPGFGNHYPDGSLEKLERTYAEGHVNEALRVLMREIIGMPKSEIDFMESSPAWTARVNAFSTVPRECRADRDFDLRALAAEQLSHPLLILSGQNNARNKQRVAEAIRDGFPDTRLVEVEGEGHAAHHTAPERLSDLVREFLD